MIPEHHIELLKRALPLISSDTIAAAVADVLMTGERPTPQNAQRELLPHAAKLFERYVVHLINPKQSKHSGEAFGYDWAADGLERYMTKPDLDYEPRTH